MNRIFTLLTLSHFTLIPPSIECWLQPDKFIYKWNEDINIRLFTGENFEGSDSEDGHSGLATLSVYFDGMKDDLPGDYSDENFDSIQLKILDEGTAMVVYNSFDTLSGMESEEFNVRLEKKGLSKVLDYRKQNNEMNSAGYLNHQQSVKTIFQVGKKYNNTFKIETSLPVDFIPQQNPYSLREGDSLEVLVLFQNEPISKQPIRLWHKKEMRTIITELITNEKGLIKFPVTLEGIWMLSTEKSERQIVIEKTGPIINSWQSFTGSCTWGYE